MTNTDLQNNSGDIRFVDHHYPALQDGRYNVTVTQTAGSIGDPSTMTKRLVVTGPRFDLASELIHSHNPMRGSALAQDGVIPTIAFNRNTLPWERSPGPDGTQDGASWLALLLVTEEEIQLGSATESTAKLSEIEDSLDIAKLDEWALYEAYRNKDVNLLTLRADLFNNIMPKYGDLKWLSHCRQNRPDGSTVQAELTYLLSNRLPTPGKLHTMYLVSVENRYADTQDETTATIIGDDSDPQSLAYLYKWQFTCQSAATDDNTFRKLLEQLDTGPLREHLRSPVPIARPKAKQLLASGRSVLAHQLRNGERTYSWYRGPLAATAESDLGLALPAATADDLLIFDRQTGMLDTSYAAAWTVGRMKCLENKTLSTDLFRWRHRQLHATVGAQHPIGFSHLPFEPPVAAAFPAGVTQKLKGYALLKGIPFENCVPLPTTLPNESLRFFYLDPNWLRAFMDGFFSVGRVHGVDDWAEEQSHFPSFDHPVTGVLLRSDAVAGWKNMHINAYQEAQDGEDYDSSATVLQVLRKAYLAPDVLLLMFKGVPKTLDVYLAPEALHLGFLVDDAPGDNPSYSHQVKNPCTGEDGIGTVVTINESKGNNTYRTYAAGQLAGDFEERINAYFRENKQSMPCLPPEGFTITSAYFGFELIEGAPLVRFQLNANGLSS